MERLLGAVEAGGTKFVVAVGELTPRGPHLVAPEVVIPTGDEPGPTLDLVASSLRRLEEATGPVAAVGVASFGPLHRREGVIGATPKPGWSGFRLRDELRSRLRGEPAVEMDTDVNAAVRAEAAWGAARSAPVAVYLTVGTGIGGGIAIHGEVVEGLLHPEMGHVTVPRLAGDGFEGSCRFHGACLEGMASGVAVAARWGIKGEDLPGDHPAWVLEARYLAAGIAQVVLVLSPNVVVAGGGVMRQSGLRAAVNTRLMEAMGGYAPAPPVVPPRFGDRAGLMGALALADVAASR